MLVARMQVDGRPYLARVSLYRGMFWLQFALLAPYVDPLRHSLLVYLDSCRSCRCSRWSIGSSWRRTSSAVARRRAAWQLRHRGMADHCIVPRRLLAK